jgi:membrane protein implicated in regulation of membrane protease activity
MGAVRLSRPRVLLRAALLVTGGAYMLWRAWAMNAGAAGQERPEAVLQERLALVWALMGALAIATAIAALLSLRPRRRRHTLHLEGEDRAPPGPPTDPQ